MKMGKGLVGGLVAGGVILAAAGCVFVTQSLWRPAEIKYKTAVARIGDVEITVQATGSLQPTNTVEVAAEIPGRVMSLSVKRGDHVKIGDPIAIIQSRDLRSNLQNAQQQVNNLTGNMQNFQRNVTFSKSNLDRYTALKEKGITSQVQVENAISQLNNAQFNVTSMEGQLASARVRLQSATADLDKENVRAPVEGEVAEIVNPAGQVINNFQGPPTIVKIVTTDVMTVYARIPEADINKIHPGQRAYFTILGQPGRRFYGELRFRDLNAIGRSVGNTGAIPDAEILYNVLFDVPNTDNLFLPAMTADVHVIMAEAKKAVLIPARALGLKRPDGLTVVRVMGANNRPIERNVLVGVNNGEMAEIKDGLNAGEIVVVPDAPVVKDDEGPKPLLGGLSAPK